MRNRDLTFCAEPGHDTYPLPPLPLGFCWREHEIIRPAFACQVLNDVSRLEES